MTIFNVAGGERALTVRYLPVVAWSFLAVAIYGVANVVQRMLDGRTPVNAGSLVALAALVGFSLFVFYTGGEVVVATFDRAADQVRVRRFGLTGLHIESRRLSQLAGLDVRVLRRAQHRLELRFASGELLPLTSYYVVTLNSNGLRRLCAMLGVEPTVVKASSS